jgi:hypothetical protein
MTADIPAARITARYGAPEYFVTVEDADGEVRVRWRFGRAQGWRCDACGPMATTDCRHTFAAGLLLAEELLGLTRNPELHPITERPHR